VIPPSLLAVALVIGLLALVPARRLFLAGRPSRYIASYFGALCALGLVAVIVPPAARTVLPLLALLYVFPFVNWRSGLERLIGRRTRIDRPPMKNVTPPADRTAETR
jgi:hypothetical protein